MFKKLFSKQEWSWIMYDWANSIYATNIMAAIYPTIFASTVEGGDIKWGYATSIATFIVAILSPFLGAVADHKGMKKKLFATFLLLGVCFTPLMAFFGNYRLCLIGYVISRIGFTGGNVFYDSFLTDVTTSDRMDKVSSWGYAMGYIGGSTIPFVISIGVLLAFDYSQFAQVFSVLIVTAWWAAFSIPMLKNVHHTHYLDESQKMTFKSVMSSVGHTFKQICKRKGLLIFVIAYFLYIDGVDTIISISTADGATLGLGATGMILALLVTQIVAVPCSIWFSKLAERFSTRKALIGAISVYIAICLCGFYMGFSMEPSQQKCNDDITAALSSFEVDSAVSSGALKAVMAEDYALEISELTKDEAVQTALISVAEDNKADIDEYRAAISFSTMLFWIMAFMVGTVQGGIQAVSRSYFGKLIPKEESNEYYGFFDIFGKFASVIGPIIYSTAAALTGRSSFGVIGLALLFIGGLILLVSGRKYLEADC